MERMPIRAEMDFLHTVTACLPELVEAIMKQNEILADIAARLPATVGRHPGSPGTSPCDPGDERT